MLTSPPDPAPSPTAPTSSPPTPPSLADAAEEVRAWFVQVRGGAPFLSSADGDALVGWLEAGVPVSRILRAIDTTAERRRAARSRRPFALRDVRAVLLGKRRRAYAEPPAPESPASAGTSAAPGSLPFPDPAPVLAAIHALPPGDPEVRARAACALARAFHDATWAGLGDAREALLAEAAAELGALAEAISPEELGVLCEEVARDRVRARYPELSASRLWLECARGLE